MIGEAAHDGAGIVDGVSLRRLYAIKVSSGRNRLKQSLRGGESHGGSAVDTYIAYDFLRIVEPAGECLEGGGEVYDIERRDLRKAERLQMPQRPDEGSSRAP